MPVDKKQHIDHKISELMLAWGDLVLAAGLLSSVRRVLETKTGIFPRY